MVRQRIPAVGGSGRRPTTRATGAAVLGRGGELRVGLHVAVEHVQSLLDLLEAVKPLVDGSARILWQAMDQGVIDRTINDGADGARHLSDNVRHMQSGNLRSYAGWVAAGAAVVIAYMVWTGLR